MGISVLQPSFAGGELSPLLYSRVDLARYQIGLATCLNFTVMSGGGIRNRPGTRLVDNTPGNLPVKLVRFKFSVSDSCLLVFGDHVMRVVRNGAYVLDGSNNIYSIATPWAPADFEQLNYTQSADVMTFVHPLYRPRELKRFANNNWTITEPTYVPAISPPASISLTTPPGGTGAQKLTAFQVTTVIDDAFSIQESLPVKSTYLTTFNSTGHEINLSWPAVAGATYYNIYKDDTVSGVFGFAGRSVSATFTDRNIAQTKTDTPPTGFDPFVGAGNYPGAVGYYQQRKVYGGSLNKPQTMWFSRTGVFNNYGYSTPSKDDDAITWTMASTEVNQILNFLPLKDSLMTFTNGAEWAIQGQASGFTAKTINGNPQSYNGSGYVQPLVLNDTAIYLQNRGRAVSALNYSLESDGIASEDLLIWSTHLVRDYSIVSWAYQRLPDSIVWAIRADGTAIALTYLRKQDVVAWHRHETDGFIEAVACVPEGTEDAVYFVIRRTIGGVAKRFIERLQAREIPLVPLSKERDIAQAYFVDCGLSYNGWQAVTNTRRLTGGTNWTAGETLNLVSATAEFAAGDVGKVFALRDPVTLDMLYLNVTGFTSTTSVQVKPMTIVPDGLRNIDQPYFGRAVKTVSGIGHLEGKAVAILADGNVVTTQAGNLVVTGGAITLPNYSVVVHVGLPYVSDAQTLRINVTGQETLNDKKKMVSSVTIITNESRGIFAGSDPDHLFECKQREFEPYNSPVDLSSETSKISITNTWDSQGQVFIRQQDPLPLTILGIIPELTIGGKN